jgi:hypothetical protein
MTHTEELHGTIGWEDNERVQGSFILLYYCGSILEQTKGVN